MSGMKFCDAALHTLTSHLTCLFGSGKLTLLSQWCAAELQEAAAQVSQCISAVWTSRPPWHEWWIPVYSFPFMKETLRNVWPSCDQSWMVHALFLSFFWMAIWYFLLSYISNTLLNFFLTQHLGTKYNLLPTPFFLHQSFNQEPSPPLHLLPPPAPRAQQSDTLRAKNPIAVVMSALLEPGRLSRGLHNRAFSPQLSDALKYCL